MLAGRIVLCYVAMKVTSTPATSAKVTVRRTSSSSMSVGAGSSTRLSRHTSDVSSVGDGSSTRLSHQISDVSDVSTPAPVAIPGSKHGRHIREENDSSSCSSTEAVDEQQSDDVWNENPVYADLRRLRQRKLPAGFVRKTIASIDTRPLDDLLTDTRHQDHSDTIKSSVQLHRSASSPPVNQHALHTSTALENMLIIQDVANTSDHGAMIDCISVAAPDDTVIKPSQLRASMRQRRTPSSTDDFTLSRPVSEIPITDEPSVSGGASSWRNSAWRGGSLRETKRTPAVDRGTGFVRKKIVSSSAAETGNTSRHSAASSTTPTHSNTSQSSELEALSSLQHNAASPVEANTVGSLSYDELLHEFQQVYTPMTDTLHCYHMHLLFDNDAHSCSVE